MNSTCGQILFNKCGHWWASSATVCFARFILQRPFILPCPAASWSSVWPVLQVNSWSGSRPQSESCLADWYPGPAAVHLPAADRSALLRHLTHTHTHTHTSISSCYPAVKCSYRPLCSVHSQMNQSFSSLQFHIVAGKCISDGQYEISNLLIDWNFI